MVYGSKIINFELLKIVIAFLNSNKFLFENICDTKIVFSHF